MCFFKSLGFFSFKLLRISICGQVLGAMWYLSSIGRQFSCWSNVCKKDNALRVLDCLPSFLDCKSLEQPERQYWQNVTQVLSHCDATSSTTNFKFGMFAEAFTTQVATTDFVSKYLYCLWWGLRNLRYDNLLSNQYLLKLSSFGFNKGFVSQFLWTEYNHKCIPWRDLVLYNNLYFWVDSLHTPDW